MAASSLMCVDPPTACRWLFAMAAPALLAACTTSGSSLQSKQQATFMDVYNVYNHCRTAEDPETLLLDALVLHRVAQGKDAHGLPPVLKPIRKLIDPTPVRFAADPRAMAAACTLRAGDSAMKLGWNDLAIQIFTAMIPAYQAPEFSYYLREARSGLASALEHQSSPPSSASARPF